MCVAPRLILVVQQPISRRVMVAILVPEEQRVICCGARGMVWAYARAVRYITGCNVGRH